jgi:hypothetical protein
MLEQVEVGVLSGRWWPQRSHLMSTLLGISFILDPLLLHCNTVEGRFQAGNIVDIGQFRIPCPQQRLIRDFHKKVSQYDPGSSNTGFQNFVYYV